MFRFVEQDDQMLPGSESIMNRHSSSEPDGTEGSARAADGAGATEPGQAAELATATRRIKELEAALDSSIARERAPVSYTHLPSPRDGLLSRMPSSA